MLGSVAQLAHGLHAPVHDVVVKHGATVPVSHSARAVEDGVLAVLRTDVDTSRPRIVLLVAWPYLDDG